MKIRFILLFCWVFVPGVVQALGLGNIQLESALNEPLRARIELLSATAEDINSLNIGLADDAAFRRAGIPREFVLTQLRFSIKESESGPDFILVSSEDPIREPYLDFLVEINWSNGRLYREYTVLIDPPIYAADEMRSRVTPPPVVTPKGLEQTVVYYPEYKPAKSPATAESVQYTGGDYGPVAHGETLWSIARAMRPDSSISIQQMMLALLRTNPEAFIKGNINGLKKGFVLKAPDLPETRSVDKAEAFTQAELQNDMWQQIRQDAAMAPPVRPEGAPAQPQPAVSGPDVPGEKPVEEIEKPVEEIKETKPAVVEAEPELRLVAPAETGKSATQGGVVEPDNEAFAKELAIASETLEALTLENLELKDKITESDVIVGDLKRLITLKETELAALQQQVANRAAQQTVPAPVAIEPAPVAEKVEKAVMPESTTPLPAAKPSPAKPKPVKKTGPSIVSSIKAVASDLLAQLKNNLLYILGALAAVAVIFAGIYFVQRPRSDAEFVQLGNIVNGGEGPTISIDAEDVTDMNLAQEGEAESEAITIQPGRSAQSSDKTQAIGIPPPAAPSKQVVSDVAEDPLEEVNVFLAYEDFDQAEEFVKNALAKEPDNLAFHVKLLEVYYTANNRKAYEQAAQVLHDKVQGTGDHWGMALAMWQVLSPNRALFAAPAAGEETIDAPETKGAGGIVNIAGDGEVTSSALDFDLDTTGGGAGSGDTLEVEAPAEPDMLDVTAAVAPADSEILEFAPAVVSDAAGAAEQETQATTVGDTALDFSLDLEDKPVEQDQSLDISLDQLQEDVEISAQPAADEDQSLEFSLVLDSKPDEEDQPLDLSMELLQEEGKIPAEPSGGDDALDFSLDLAETADEDKTAIPLMVEPEVDGSRGDSDLLDVTSAIDIGEDALGASMAGSTLLDVTSALSLNDQEPESSRKFTGAAGEDLMDVSKPGAPGRGADLLDVTSTTDFAPDKEKDLLDVTFSGSVPTREKVKDDSALDFELAPDQPVPGDDSVIAFDGIDITAATSTPVQALELEVDSSPESEEEAFAVDMDATMKIPNKKSSLTNRDEDEDGEGGDKTVVVPRLSGDTQSDDDEIATQMDLAKAYIELGNADSAKTILDEIIAIGNDVQRRQAQDLLGQIG